MKYNPEKHHRRSIRLEGYDYSKDGAYFVTLCTYNRKCLFGNIVNGKMLLNELGRLVCDEWLRSAIIRNEIELFENEFVVMPNHIHSIVWIVDNTGTTDITVVNGITGDNGITGVGATSMMGVNGINGDNGVIGVGTTGMMNVNGINGNNGVIGVGTTGMMNVNGINGDNGETTVGATGRSPLHGERPRGPLKKSLSSFIAGYKSATTKQINQIRNTPGASVWQRNYYEHIIRNDAELRRIREYIINNPEKWEYDKNYMKY